MAFKLVNGTWQDMEKLDRKRLLVINHIKLYLRDYLGNLGFVQIGQSYVNEELLLEVKIHRKD